MAEMVYLLGGIVGVLLAVVVSQLSVLRLVRRRMIRAELNLIREVLAHERTVDQLSEATARANALQAELLAVRGVKVAAAGYADSVRKM